MIQWSSRGTVLVAAGMLLLAGCVRLSQPAPRIQEYRLDYEPPVLAGRTLPVTLRVHSFGIAAIYDRETIVYRDGTHSTGRYFYHRWSTNPRDMMADVLARDLAASGVYRAVLQGPGAPADYELSGMVEEFEERPAGEDCTAHLRLRVTLARARARAASPIVWQATYTGDEPCPCNDAPALAAAMSRGLARMSATLQDELYSAIAADTSAAGR